MATNRDTMSGSTKSGATPRPGSAGTGGFGANDTRAGDATGTAYGSSPGTTTGADAWRSSAAGSTGMHDGSARGDGDGQRGILSDLQQQVKSSADSQKNRAADGLGGIAQVFQNAGSEIRGENEMLASYVDMAGDRLRRFADTVRERGVEEMLDALQAFARRRPVVFLGGALVAGFGLARFLKSSGGSTSYFPAGSSAQSGDAYLAEDAGMGRPY
jgi:hypothetical protein